ncbi:MAG: C2H2-type zinc finger protein, partial [Candidatus Poribacteria bacterium]|nr:C2H2-type zinc finger protein [Candidatus Poribacteria bacterium]
FKPSLYRFDEEWTPTTDEETVFANLSGGTFVPETLAVYEPTTTESDLFQSFDAEIIVDLSARHCLEEVVVARQSSYAEPHDQLELPLDEPMKEVGSETPDAIGSASQREWICPICSESFRRHPAANARHERACEARRRDESDLPHVCSECGRRFATERGLRTHIGRSHPTPE